MAYDGYGMPKLDFSPLGELPQDMRKAQLFRQQQELQQNRQRTLADLAAGAPIDQVATKLFSVGDVEGGLSLARLADAQAMRKYNIQKDEREAAESKRRWETERSDPKIFGSGEGGYYMMQRGGGAPSAPVQPGAQPGVPGGISQVVPPRQSIDREQAKKDVARVERYKTEADTGRDALADVQQLRELRKGVSYEGGLLAPQRATIAGWFGEGAGQALQSKATDIQLGFSEKTKGAITDREQAMFAGATPGMSMTDAAAETVMNGMEAAALRTVERGKFFETWMRTHKSLSGAQDAWDTFIREKPVLSGDNKGGLKVNKENVTAWKSYLGSSEQPSARPANPAQDRSAIEAEMRRRGLL